MIIIVVISVIGSKGIGGYKAFNILTGSMSPTIKPGSLIVTQNIEKEDIKPNDVITFKGSNTSNITTHRVVEVIEDKGENIKFQTKGDANDVLDPMLIGEELVVGKVLFSIPHLGSIINFVAKYKFIIVGLLAICLFVSSLFNKSKPKEDI